MSKLREFLDRLFMDTTQQFWLDRFKDISYWRLKYPEEANLRNCLVSQDGKYTIFASYAGGASIVFNDSTEVCVFVPDWFGTRERVTKKLVEALSV